ncbi:MAG: tRNA (guanosine(37)-N1)-methyltransferase TrmD [Proteobacteria bacterium]|nr:tRNA (guanosine(37)-N1)-methyltransferase TrmD [Pseudomonadota bacterium]
MISNIGVITLFPDMFEPLKSGITGRALKNQLLNLKTWNPRDFTTDNHRNVDDKPYGGGPGMVMMVQPIRDAVQAAKTEFQGACKTIYLSPRGRLLNQTNVVEFASLKNLILVAGRYEGIDERLMDSVIDEEWSIGDYVLSGGELAAMVFIDAIIRLLPGAIGDEQSLSQESFTEGLLEYPQYTRPEVIDGKPVPRILLGGNHEHIRRWKLQQSLGLTFKRRPELLKQRILTTEEQQLLDEYIRSES